MNVGRVQLVVYDIISKQKVYGGWLNPKEMGDAYVDFWLYSQKGINVSVFEALMFAMTFATLILKISDKNNTKQTVIIFGQTDRSIFDF